MSGPVPESLTSRSKLARTLAGFPAEQPPPISSLDFAPPASPFPPYTGLRNEPAPPGLPPFEQPGQSANMMPWRGLPQQMPPQTVAAAPPQPTAPPMNPMGGQGFAGVEPPPGPAPVPYDANLDPRFLPEQWRGAFSRQG